jgi:DNA-binding PadR family transcriptional regulator
MTKSRAWLTELEGAMLGIIRHDPSCTAYRVRQVFLASRSAAWSGSAGAVYPAINRLAAEGLIGESAAQDGRGTRTYRLTAAGARAHDAWLCDAERAIDAGLDPFRTRAGFWSVLPPKRLRALLKELAKALERRRAGLRRELPSLDEGDAAMATLHVALLDLRLNWITARLKKTG